MAKYGHNFVELVVFFTCSSTYAILTIFPEFVYQFVSESHNFSSHRTVDYCEDNPNSSNYVTDENQVVTVEVSRWTQISSISQALLNTVSVLVLTSWSEVIGRRNALLFPVIGSIICSALLIINIHFRLSLWLYVASSVIYGASGGWTALLSISTAHLSGIVPAGQRSERYTLLEICGTLGGGMSLIGTGIWAEYYGFFQPSIFIFFCALLALLFTVFLRTEDVAHERDLEDIALRTCRAETTKNGITEIKGFASILSQLREVARVYTSNTIKCGQCKEIECKHSANGCKNRVWRLWFYLLTYVVYMAAVDGYGDFMTMFLVNTPLCFSPLLIGMREGMSCVVTIFSPIAIKIYLSVFHFSNQTILLIAMLGKIVFSVIMLFARRREFVFIATSLGVITNITTPFIRVQVSNLVSPTEQGPALALIPCFSKLMDVINPAILLTIYPATLHIMPSFIWFVILVYFVIAFLLMAVVWVADTIKRGKTSSLMDDRRITVEDLIDS